MAPDKSVLKLLTDRSCCNRSNSSFCLSNSLFMVKLSLSGATSLFQLILALGAFGAAPRNIIGSLIYSSKYRAWQR